MTFTPQYKGTIKGALDISLEQRVQPADRGLSGPATGGPSAFEVQSHFVDFLVDRNRRDERCQNVTVTNKSTDTITINGISASANFAAVGSGNSPCGGALAQVRQLHSVCHVHADGYRIG